jgi:hypothetical protein
VEDEARVFDVRILVDVLDPPRIERRRATLDAVDDITQRQKQLGEIGAVLTGHAGDQSDLSVQRNVEIHFGHALR